MSNKMLLGIIDGELSDNVTNWMINKIGGEPDWMPECCSNTPSLRCELCDRRLVFVVQLYSPLDKSVYQRTIYVFCCINKSCWNKQQSWQVYSNQHLYKEERCSELKTNDQEADLWLPDELEWEDESSENFNADISVASSNRVDNLDEFPLIENISKNEESEESSQSFEDDYLPRSEITERFVEKFRQTGEKLPWDSSNIPTVSLDHKLLFKSFYINVIEESPETELNNDEHVQRLLSSYHMHEGIDTVQNGNCFRVGGETYEKDWVKHGDYLFQKFVNRVARCQKQIIRYCWNGEPLLMSRIEEILPMSCQYCGGPLIFEFQLMPALIEYLKISDIEGVPVEFGTIIVRTCQAGCWQNGISYHKENVYVQSDPDEILFQQRT